jgi:hypothetical protein
MFFFQASSIIIIIYLLSLMRDAAQNPLASSGARIRLGQGAGLLVPR